MEVNQQLNIGNIPLSSGSPLHFPAVCLKVPAFPSARFQSDLTHRDCHPSVSNVKSETKFVY